MRIGSHWRFDPHLLAEWLRTGMIADHIGSSVKTARDGIATPDEAVSVNVGPRSGGTCE